MSRHPLPLPVADISAFALSLRRQLDGLERLPGHVEMLNALSRAGGFRNFQHFRAQCGARQALAAPAPEAPAPQVDYRRVRRAARLFDGAGRLTRWPKKYSERLLCLWALWSRMPVRASFTEAEVSRWLEERHLFGDYALLRREMVDNGLVVRTADGRSYKRVEQRPPDEALELLRCLRA
ncbi:DUF2087 domain-containing protein [Desulfocurvus sp. DL9XJH121]